MSRQGRSRPSRRRGRTSLVSTLSWATVLVEGDDARTFLDGQLSQQIDDVMLGSWSNLLDPSSVVISALWIRGGPLRYELLVPNELASAVEARLRRFLIRVRCEISARNDALDPPLRTLSDLEEQRWPWVNEFQRELTPHSFGANYIARTISFTKGCFTGQELVGRMDARGASMPWRFALASGPSLELIESTIADVGPSGPKGVTTVLDALGVRAFAIVHRSCCAEGANYGAVHFEAVA